MLPVTYAIRRGNIINRPSEDAKQSINTDIIYVEVDGKLLDLEELLKKQKEEIQENKEDK